MEGLHVAGQGGDERIPLNRPPHLLAHAACALPGWIEYAIAIARADQTSRLIPYSGPGMALRPMAACPPKRSMSAWRIVGVLGPRVAAQGELHGPPREQDDPDPVGGLGEASGPQDRIEHLGADRHPVGLDLLDHDDVGQPARPERPHEDVVGGDPEPLRAGAVEAQPGGLGRVVGEGAARPCTPGPPREATTYDWFATRKASFGAVGNSSAIPAIVNSTVLRFPVASGTRTRMWSPGTML